MKVTVGGVEYTCDSALRGDDYVLLFTDGMATISFHNIADFDDFVLDGGDWSYPYVTLAPNLWVGDSAPYTQNVSHAGVTPSNDVLVSPRLEGVDEEELEAFAECKVGATYQGDGYLTFSAYGKKPEVTLKFNIKTLF